MRAGPSRKNSKQAASGPAKPWETAKRGKGSASDPLAVRFVESLSFDRRLYKHDIAGSIAHAQMLADVNLITRKDLAQIRRGLRQIEKQINTDGNGWKGWKTELEDVHMCIEAALIESVGEPGRKLHTGRSRNDQVALDLQLWILEATGRIENAGRELIEAFIALAKRDGEVVMPAYTHLQRAQPIVAGGELIAWVTAISRGLDRIAATRQFHNRHPLGSGAVAGSSLPLDRSKIGKLLGQAGWTATDNAIDATAFRDGAIDFVYALAMLAMTLSRWSEQWILYATSEFGFIKLDDRYTTGSSMMPQKHNPDMLELIRGRTGGVYGQLMALLTICKGLPIGYNRDLQEDKRSVFAAYDLVLESLTMGTRIVATTRFNRQTIAAKLGDGFLDATSLAEYLVTRGVAFRTAHQIVGSLVQACQQRGLSQLSQMELSQFNQACDRFAAGQDRCGPDVYRWLGADQVVRRYRTAGNAGQSGFTKQLKKWERRLRNWKHRP